MTGENPFGYWEFATFYSIGAAFGLLVLISFIVGLLIYRNRQRKRRESISLLTTKCSEKQHRNGNNSTIVCTKDKIKMSVKPSHSIQTYTTSSSTSSSEADSGNDRSLGYLPQSPMAKSSKDAFFFQSVQPKTADMPQMHAEKRDKDRDDKYPRISFSISRLDKESDNEEQQFKITLMKASNLRTSATTSAVSKGLTNTFRNTRPGGVFVPDGIFVRFYANTNLENKLSPQSSSDESKQRDHRSSIECTQTVTIKVKHPKIVKFDEKEAYTFAMSKFPLRISVYEVDKHNVRGSLGHCIIDPRTDDSIRFASNVILNRRLYPTLLRARNQ